MAVLLLRAAASHGPASSQLQCLSRLASTISGGWQATFWHGSSLPGPLMQLQQLHTTAAQAVPVPAPAQQQQQPSQAAAGGDNALQPAGQSAGTLTTLQSGQSSRGVGPELVGLYYDFDKSLVPEAFQPFQQAFYSPRPSKLQRKGGCRGLQEELGLTHSSSLMWRRSSQELLQLLSSGAPPRVHLRGPVGAGKSIAAVQMVEWARNNGWIALYVPAADALTRGGFFYRRPEDGTYDTIISAQHILKSMADSHAQQLAGLPLRLPESAALLQQPAAAEAEAAAGELAAGAAGAGGGPQEEEGGAGAGGGKGGKKGKKGGGGAAAHGSVEGSLMQLVVAGLSTDDDARLAVECVLALVRELAALAHQQQPVLLAVDNYGALHHATDYGRTLFVTPQSGPAYQTRRAIRVNQLNLARAMRLLERTDLGDARVLAADSGSSRLPADLRVPAAPGATTYQLPRFSEVETAHALHHYHERGLTALPPSARQVAAMRALTNGSGADLRRWCLKVTQTDLGML